MKNLLLWMALATSLAGAEVDPAKGLILENRQARFEFEPGGMGLKAMVDRASGVDHLRGVDGPRLLWQVDFGKGTQVRSITNNYKPCNFARLEKLAGGGQRAVMEWNDLRWWLENGVVTVRVQVDLAADSGVAEWRIFVENRSDYWGLWSVTFPLVKGFPAAGEYDIARPTQSSGGQLLKGWTKKIEARYPSGNWPMQFAALMKGRSAIYFATQDSEARAKDFVIEPGVKLAVVHYPDNMGVAGSDYPDYYPVMLGVYQGRWVEAARRYRPWALGQKWAQAGRISARPEMSELLKNIGAWVQDGWTWQGREGTPLEMNEPLLAAQKTMGTPLGIHWYMWHQTPFDNQYPHFLPSKPGFRERVKQLVERGFLVMPYINGTSADFNIPDFAKFAPHAIRDEAGGLRMTRYSEEAGRLLAMCPTQEFWQGEIATVVNRLVREEGVNGVYIDQIGSMGHDLCFDANHGHPIGGGHYWADGNRDLLRKVQNVAHRQGRHAVITTEGTDEIFFDVLDANLTWAQATDWEIPLMQVVYSGYTLLFASPCDFTASERLFNFSQGQAFVDGRQIGWMSLNLFKPEYARKAEYFRQCARYRVAARKFLTYGRMLEPIEPLKAVPTFGEDGFGWNQKHRGTVPSAEGRLWQSEDGHLGVLLANYVDEPVAFAYRIDAAAFGLAGGRYRLAEITPEGRREIGTMKGPIERTETLGPREIKMIEIE